MSVESIERHDGARDFVASKLRAWAPEYTIVRARFADREGTFDVARERHPDAFAIAYTLPADPVRLVRQIAAGVDREIPGHLRR